MPEETPLTLVIEAGDGPAVLEVNAGERGPAGTGTGGAAATETRFASAPDGHGGVETYLGKAPAGSDESAPVWTIRKDVVTADGEVLPHGYATGAWSQRADLLYLSPP
jgi:hypothetical protein